MARSANLEGFHVFAREVVRSQFTDNLVDIPVFLAALSRRGRVSGTFGKLDSRASVGRPLPNIANISQRGSTLRHIPFRKNQSGAGKVLDADGTDVSVGTDRSDTDYSTVPIHWAHLRYGIAIRNEQLRQAAGSGKRKEDSARDVFNVINQVTSGAMNDFIAGTTGWTGIADRIYTGNPGSQSTDEPWDNLLGLQEWIHDSNTIATHNRSNVDGFSGVRLTGSKQFSLDLIDEATIDYDGAGTGLKDKGARLDLWIVPNHLYRKVVQEAMATHGVIQHDDMPGDGKIGFIHEHVNYRGKLIVADPYCPDNHMFGIDSRTWEFEVDPDFNFRVGEFKDLTETLPASGQSDTTRARLDLRARLMCFDPGKNIQYTNVS